MVNLARRGREEILGSLSVRRTFYAGLLVLAGVEWITLAIGIPLVTDRIALVATAVSWTAITLSRVEIHRLQPFAVELTVSCAGTLTASYAWTTISGTGMHYWTHAHPVGTFLSAWWAVAFLPAVLLFSAELVRAFRCWISGWLYLRRTTPEERILEKERR